MASRDKYEDLSSDSYNDEYNCKRCSDKGATFEAKCYCQTCQCFFCDGCKGLHKEFASDHNVLDESEKNLWGKQETLDLVSKTCPVHVGEKIIIFCGQHDILCCAVCAALDHSTCMSKAFVPDLVKDISNSKELKHVITELHVMLSELSVQKGTLFKLQTSLNDSCLKCKDTIENISQNVDSKMDELVNDSKQEMEKLYQDRSRNLKDTLDNIGKFYKELSDLQNICNEDDDSMTDVELFIKVKNGQGMVQDCTEFFHIYSQPTNFDIAFSLDAKLLHMLEKERFFRRTNAEHQSWNVNTNQGYQKCETI